MPPTKRGVFLSPLHLSVALFPEPDFSGRSPTSYRRSAKGRLVPCWSGRFGALDNGATETTARPTRMVSHDPIKDYMRRHACGFPEALEALAAQLGPPTAHDIRHALQTLGRAGAPVDLLEALEAWSDGQMQQVA